mgnify:CR=1 FL=1
MFFYYRSRDRPRAFSFSSIRVCTKIHIFTLFIFERTVNTAMKNLKKILAMCLAVIMMLSCIPAVYAADVANAHEFIARQPDGYDAVLGERGVGLSGGERQRISIARAMLRNPKMLVFDEPEAGIDLWSFTNLIEAFQRLKTEDERSLLVISHQERIMEIADHIVVISDGKVKMQGSRDEILPQLLSEHGAAHRCPLGKSVKEEF